MITRRNLLLSVFVLAGSVWAIDLPDKLGLLDGFTAFGPQAQYSTKTLFGYINGGADVYIDAGFTACYARSYKGRDGLSDVTINIYKFGSIPEAFGLFRTLLGEEKPERGIGVESVSDGRRFCFWKNKYYVEILDKSVKALDPYTLQGAGRAVSGWIPGSPALPSELTWFPLVYKTHGSELYYRKGFLSRSFLSNVFTSEYRQNGVTYQLFVLTADSEDEAMEFMGKLADVYPPRKEHPAINLLAGKPIHYSAKILAVLEKNRVVGVVSSGKVEFKAYLIDDCIKRIGQKP